MGAEERWNGCEVVPANKLGYWERWDGRGGLLYGEYNIKDNGQLKRGGRGLLVCSLVVRHNTALCVTIHRAPVVVLVVTVYDAEKREKEERKKKKEKYQKKE